VINPEQPIATLDRGGVLRMTLTVTTGRGYVAADRAPATYDAPIGTIAVDGLFSPIRRVSYAITEARVAGSTDHERLTLHVTTNGALGPEDAVSIAACILRHQLTPFERNGEPFETTPVLEEASSFDENLLRPLDDLTLSVRAANCMESARIVLVGDLVHQTDRDILRIRNMGRKTLREIQGALREIGLSLGMNVSGWPEVRAQHMEAIARVPRVF
jgi:DNA-directed RNA polymerase subunit alpha